MDPSALSGGEWIEINNLVSSLWLMVGLILFFVTNLMIGLVFIPTLVASYHVPAKAHKTRPVFYLIALASFAGAVALFARVVDIAGLLENLYPTYWI